MENINKEAAIIESRLDAIDYTLEIKIKINDIIEMVNIFLSFSFLIYLKNGNPITRTTDNKVNKVHTTTFGIQ